MNKESLLQTEEYKNLKPFNTFGVDCLARYYLKIEDVDTMQKALQTIALSEKNLLVLGGGSNMLFIGDYEGLILHNAIKGTEILEENADSVKIRVGGGMNWHKFVEYCVEQEWGGIENLALIPGTVGAAPIQNIGAYGVELEEVFVSLRAVDMQQNELVTFEKKECEFDYRDSIFKRGARNRYFIVDITLILSKKNQPETSYRSLSDYLSDRGIKKPGIKDIFDAVVDIRQSKLPDPSEIGNAGSFFKNPVVSLQKFQSLQQDYPGIPGYSLDNERVKVPAAWLIDTAGWKGERSGDVGTYPHQPLVIVNYGEATGAEIMNFAAEIRNDVLNKFSIKLEPEVNIITSGDSDWKRLLTG